MTTVPTPPISFAPFAVPTQAFLPEGTAANDVLEDREYERLLGHPRVRSFLEQKLRSRRMPRAQKEDLVGAVFEKLWERRTDRSPANTLPRMLGLARAILKAKLVDRQRHQKIVDETTGEPPEEHDDVRSPHSKRPDKALHVKQQMLFVNEMAPKLGITEDDLEVMYAMTYDREGDQRATWETLAAERNTTPGALRKRIERLQQAMRAAWNRRLRGPLLLTLILLAMLLLYVLAAIGPARHAPPPEPAPQPTVHQLAPEAPPAMLEEVTPDVPAPGK
jgi:hypothetical protein